MLGAVLCTAASAVVVEVGAAAVVATWVVATVDERTEMLLIKFRLHVAQRGSATRGRCIDSSCLLCLRLFIHRDFNKHACSNKTDCCFKTWRLSCLLVAETCWSLQCLTAIDVRNDTQQHLCLPSSAEGDVVVRVLKRSKWMIARCEHYANITGGGALHTQSHTHCTLHRTRATFYTIAYAQKK